MLIPHLKKVEVLFEYGVAEHMVESQREQSSILGSAIVILDKCEKMT